MPPLMVAEADVVTAALLCLAMTVQREAGGEPAAVQAAVVHVIRNRSTTRHKPVCRVTRARRQFQSIRRRPRPDIIQTVRRAWWAPDKTHGATHFHDPREYPGWAKKMHKTASIGRLRFYREKSQ
jgi:spore germination cell wall hydrolase CwlJ-like protein